MDRANGSPPSQPDGEPRKKKLSPDEVTGLLKASARKRRPRRLVMLVVILLLFGVPLGVLAYFFWPRVTPPQLLIVAFDDLHPLGGQVVVQARVVSPQDATNVRLEGWPIIFQEQVQKPGPGRVPWHEKSKSDANGVATAAWAAPTQAFTLTFKARYQPDEKHGAEDQGRVFCLDLTTSLIVLDVERSLVQAELPAWASKNIVEIAAREEAVKALPDLLKDRLNRALVYLACSAPDPAGYRKVRGWVQSRKLPDGPVLGRISYTDGSDEKSALAQRLKGLKFFFTGKVVGVTSDPATAAAFQAAGLKTFLVGSAEPAPTGILAVKDWKQLSKDIDHN